MTIQIKVCCGNSFDAAGTTKIPVTSILKCSILQIQKNECRRLAHASNSSNSNISISIFIKITTGTRYHSFHEELYFIIHRIVEATITCSMKYKNPSTIAKTCYI